MFLKVAGTLALANGKNSPISFSEHLIIGASYEIDDWLFDLKFENDRTHTSFFNLQIPDLTINYFERH